jgi:hydrogenase maturation factor
MNDELRRLRIEPDTADEQTPEGSRGGDQAETVLSSSIVHCSSASCITCGDIALAVRVLSIDHETGLGLVTLEDGVEQVDLSLVDDIAPGDLILVHGGVALERLEIENPRSHTKEHE